MTTRRRWLVPPRRSDDAGNLMVAIALGIIVSGLIVTLLHNTITSIKGTSRDRAYTVAVHVADTGLQHALYTLNRHRNASDLATRMTDGATRTTASGDFTWTATAVENNRAWQITAKGSVRGRSRTVIGTARNFVFWPHAVLTDRSTDLLGGNTVDSYDSSQNLWPALSPGQGTLGTNGTIKAGAGSTTVDGGVTLYDTVSNPSLNRCTGACSPLRTEHYPRDLASADALAFIANPQGSGALDVCKSNLGTPLPDWIASRDGGTGPTAVFPPTTQSGPYCFRQLVFDRNTTLATGFDAGTPAHTYVEETFVVRPRVRVNALTGATNPPVSPALRVYTPTEGAINFGSQSVFAGAVYAPRAECGDKSGGAVRIYGALVCGTFDTRGGWNLHYDVALQRLTANTYSLASWQEG